MKPIWIVDDDQSIRFVLEKALAREQLSARSFSSAAEVLSALETDEPQVLVSDIRMPGASGIELLGKVKARLPGLPVIVMTAYSDLDSAVSAFQGGAFEYLPKPFDVPKAVELIRRAMEESLREDKLRIPVQTQVPEMLGQAPAMQDVFRGIGRLSQSHVTVLITGESGTGKELVARALHKHSPRADGPFVAINTAAIPKDLLESELFGHERGAFTGAQTMRRGRFEQADGGTLFLDEIGDMPFDLQTRLLRVLSDGQFYRVGGHQPLKANVRVIAATHQNLEARVRQGVFREDLFHRLNVIRLRLPALRERREDIPALARFFLVKSARELGVDAKRITEGALQQLMGCPFPGNVRQLENVCHWLTVMAPAQVVEAKDLPPDLMAADVASTSTLGAGPSTPQGASAGPDAVAIAGFAPPAVTPASPVAVAATAGASAALAVADETSTHGQAPAGALAASASFPSAPGAAPWRPDTPGVPVEAAGTVSGAAPGTASTWVAGLELSARHMLAAGRTDVWDQLTREFEGCLIRTALDMTRGRRIEAAQRLGIGRNTITRKIQELGLDD
jgi:two-component system nitrogen regulation response regulator GlnG